MEVEMREVTKIFPPSTVANDNVTINVKSGEVHALLGQNGAGKTTLMKILSGLIQPDKGRIILDGREVRIRSPKDAIKLGIAMVHQHFMLIPSETVVQNVALVMPDLGVFSPFNKARERLVRTAEHYGLNIDPDRKIWQLSVGEQQRVEILKALVVGAKLLILDEPTSVLTPLEATQLFRSIREMVRRGLTVIFITHKLNEVFEVSDRVTVMRQGKVVKTLLTADCTKEELARLMIGEVPNQIRAVEPEEDTVMKITELTVRDDRDLVAVDKLSLELRKGEILGLAGVAGNGQKELVEAIVGLRKAEHGTITLFGEDITNLPPNRVREKGVGYIPEDRERALVPNMSVAENLILTKREVRFKREEIRDFTLRTIRDYNIIAPSLNTPVRFLSGGNQQLLIVARELSAPQPKVLIAESPTHGLDIARTNLIHQKLQELKAKGCGILLVSEDLDEIIERSDRVAVIYRGKIVALKRPAEYNREELSLLMTTGRSLR